MIIGNPAALEHLADHENSGIFTYVIVQGELIDMAKRSQRKTDNLVLTQQFLQGVYVYPVDEKVAETYGKLKASLFHQFAPKEKSKRRQMKSVWVD
jgi:tRNA(fMet)-specific endonuclease VapC